MGPRRGRGVGCPWGSAGGPAGKGCRARSVTTLPTRRGQMDVPFPPTVSTTPPPRKLPLAPRTRETETRPRTPWALGTWGEQPVPGRTWWWPPLEPVTWGRPDPHLPRVHPTCASGLLRPQVPLSGARPPRPWAAAGRRWTQVSRVGWPAGCGPVHARLALRSSTALGVAPR